MDKKKVFLVDDDEFYLSTIGNVLKDKYEVITAKSGKDTLEYLQNGIVPNLFLLDIFMPELDGWETFLRIRKISSLQDVPIVFVTSAIELANVKHAQEIGAADYITKPYSVDNFLNRIEKILKE
jgi:putative two-component system response regulator